MPAMCRPVTARRGIDGGKIVRSRCPPRERRRFGPGGVRRGGPQSGPLPQFDALAARECAGRTGVKIQLSIAEPDAGARAHARRTAGMRIGGRTCGPGGSGAWPARYAGRYRWMRETGRALRGSGAACDAPARCRRKGPAESRCGDSKARSGAPAAAGRAGHGSMRDRAPGRAVASSRGRARRRKSAGDPAARACRAAPDGARPATPNGRPGSRMGRPVARQSERYGCPDRGPTAGSSVRTSAVALLRSLTMRLTLRA